MIGARRKYATSVMMRNQKQRGHHENSLSARPKYSPVNDTAKAFHTRPEKVRFLFGGNRSGKTYTVTAEGADICRRVQGGKGIAMTNSFKGVGLYLWPTYRKHFAPHEYKVVSWISKQKEIPEIIRVHETGFLLYFGSYEQGRENLQGAKWDFFHPDEEPPEDIYKEVYRGTIDNAGKVIGSMTPLKGKTYVYHDIFMKAAESKNIWCGTMSLLDNPYIPEEEKRAFIEMLSEKDRLSRIEGQFVNQEGLVYGEFDENIHVIDPFPVPSSWRFYRGIDLGWNDPTTSIIVAYDGHTFYLISEYYQAERLLEYHAARMHAQHAGIIFSDQPPGMLVDLLTVADHEKQIVEEYSQKHGIYSSPAKKDIVSGIEVVRSIIHVRSDGSTRLKVFRTCKKSIGELQTYSYCERGKQTTEKKRTQPIDADNHIMDPLRWIAVEECGYLSDNVYEILSVT